MIEKIVIGLDDRTYELSLQEAEDLYNELKGLFGGKETYIPLPWSTPKPVNPDVPRVWYTDSGGNEVNPKAWGKTS